MTKSQISFLITSLIHTTILILSHIKYCTKSLGNISPNFESKFIITATVSRPYTQETKIQKNGGLSRKNIIYFTFTDTKFEVLFVNVADVQKCKYKKLSGLDLAVLKDFESLLET